MTTLPEKLTIYNKIDVWTLTIIMDKKSQTTMATKPIINMFQREADTPYVYSQPSLTSSLHLSKSNEGGRRNVGKGWCPCRCKSSLRLTSSYEN